MLFGMPVRPWNSWTGGMYGVLSNIIIKYAINHQTSTEETKTIRHGQRAKTDENRDLPRRPRSDDFAALQAIVAHSDSNQNCSCETEAAALYASSNCCASILACDALRKTALPTTYMCGCGAFTAGFGI